MRRDILLVTMLLASAFLLTSLTRGSASYPLARGSASCPPTLKLALLKYAGGGDWYNAVNSLNAAISTVHAPDSCSSMLRIAEPGNTPRYGPTMRSR